MALLQLNLIAVVLTAVGQKYEAQLEITEAQSCHSFRVTAPASQPSTYSP